MYGMFDFMHIAKKTCVLVRYDLYGMLQLYFVGNNYHCVVFC